MPTQREWELLVFNGREYVRPTSDGTTWAVSARQAVKKFGLDDPMYSAVYTRRGYNYYTGKALLYSPETMAAREVGTAHADFIVMVKP